MKMNLPNKKQIEEKLVPRLNLMGYLLLVFSVCALTYGIVTRPNIYLPPMEEEGIEEADLGPDAFDVDGSKINLYFISATFAVVGLGIIVIARKKKVTPEPD